MLSLHPPQRIILLKGIETVKSAHERFGPDREVRPPMFGHPEKEGGCRGQSRRQPLAQPVALPKCESRCSGTR